MILDIHYQAGFLDGEGTITTTGTRLGRKTGMFVVEVSISNTHLEILQAFQLIWGGKVYLETTSKSPSFKPYWKPCHNWSITGQKSLPFLKEIRDHLIIKQRQADLAILILEMPDHKFRNPYTPSQIERRIVLDRELRVLNHRAAATTERENSQNCEMQQSELTGISNCKKEQK